MKTLVLLAVSVVAMSSAVSFADDVVGRAEFYTQSNGDGPSGTIDIWEQDGKIIGQGFSVGGGNGTINLTRTAQGVQGYSLNRFFNIICGTTSCTDSGSAQLNLTLTRTTDGYTLDGSVNFVYVHASVTATAISLTADNSFELAASSNGSYTGTGATSYGFLDTYDAQLTSSGTLLNLNDPAAFIATIINSSVR